jgi:DNA ligase-1
MKRTATRKTEAAKKKVKEDKKQRNLEFYFSKQNKATNDSQKMENNPIRIKQCQANGLTIAVSEDNLSLESTVQLGNGNTIASSSSSEMSIDMDVLDFDPSKINWDGPKAPYRFLIDTFVAIEKTTSRLKIIEYLTNAFRTIIYHDPESVLPAVWLSSNAIAPPYEGIELGIGSQVLSKAITSVSGASSKTLKQYYDKYGDWGDVAYTAKVSVRTLIEPKPLTIGKVYNTLCSISKLKGSGAVDQKTDFVKKLLISCKGEEIRYLTRTLVQNLRIGAVKTTCLIALAHAFCLTRPTNMVISEYLDDKNRLFVEVKKESRDSLNAKFKAAEKLLKECYAQFPNYNGIVKCLLEHPIEKLLDFCHLRVGNYFHKEFYIPFLVLEKFRIRNFLNQIIFIFKGVPLRPMLGEIVRDLGQVFENFEGRLFNCEYKYDGQRAQIHMDANGKVTIFSRNLEVIS